MIFRIFVIYFCVCIFHTVSAKRNSKLFGYGCTVCQHGGSDAHLASIHACRRPLPPSPGYISCTYDATYMKCKGECPSGYKFPDGRTEIEIQCSSNDAIWYPIRNFPDCVSQNYRPYDQPSDSLNDHSVTLSRCKRPNAPEYGIIKCSYDSENLLCTAKCNGGYFFPGGQSEMHLQCNLIKAIWYPTSTVPDCVAWNPNSGNNQDYQGSNSEALALTLNRCRRPPSPAPGRISCTYDHSKMVCVGTCDSGYFFPNGRTEMTLQCTTRDAYWYPLETFPNCVSRDYVNQLPTSPEQHEEKNIYAVTLIRCRKPEAPEYGYSHCKYDTMSMNCTGTCRTGYYFPTGKREMILQCRTENGVWFPRGEYPACSQFDNERYVDTSEQQPEQVNHHLALTLSKCGRKEAPAAGYVNCKYDALGMNCTGTCRSGYYFPGGRAEIIIRCRTINGYWYPRNEFPDCSQHDGDKYTDTTTQKELLAVTLSKCGMRKAPRGGYVNCKYDALGMNCTGTCATGYQFPGRRMEIILQCHTENGYWYPRDEFPSCSRYEVHADLLQTRVVKKTPTTITFMLVGPRDTRDMTIRSYVVAFRKKDEPPNANVQFEWIKDTPYILDNLQPRTTYIFKFAARNDVGIGEWTEEIQEVMPPESSPESPRFITPGGNISRYPDRFEVRWTVPPDNGRPIDHFVLRYFQIERDGNVWTKIGRAVDEVIREWKNVPRFEIVSLNPNSYYKVEVRAHNQLGFSRDATMIFQTAPEVHADLLQTRVVKKTPTTITFMLVGPRDTRDMTIRSYVVAFRKKDEPPNANVQFEWIKDTPYILDNLQPRTTYIFKFAARNDVGIGEWTEEIQEVMPPESSPESPRFITPGGNISRYPDRFEVRWTVPPDNGRPIDHFVLRYFQIERDGNVWTKIGRAVDEVIREWKNVPRFEIVSLNPNSYYKVEVRAHNQLGFSRDATMVFQTAPEYEGVQTTLDEEKNVHAITLIRCRKPTAPDFGVSFCKYDSVSMNCTGTCNAGYYFPNGERETLLQCRTENGIWFPRGEYPACSQFDSEKYEDSTQQQQQQLNRQLAVTLSKCGRKDAPTAGYVNCNYDVLGMNCTGTCRTGYYFPGGRTEVILQCSTKNGYWYPLNEFPSCSPYDSDKFTDVTQQRPEELNKIKVTLSKCGRKEAPAAGYVNCKYDALGMNCTGTCRTGYYFPGRREEIILQCRTENGYWYPRNEFPSCSRYENENYDESTQQVHQEENKLLLVTLNKCSRRSAPTSGYVDCKYDAMGMNCTGTCRRNYYFPGRRTELFLQCRTENGIWYPRREFPACSPYESDTTENNERPQENNYLRETLRRCGRKTAPGNGHANCTYDALGMNCTATCKLGYIFPDGRREMLLRCRTSTAVWYPRSEFPQCSEYDSERLTETGQQEPKEDEYNPTADILSKCIKRTDPVSGYSYCRYDQFGMNCTGRCRRGYYFPDGKREMTLRCSPENGFWYPLFEFPTCSESVANLNSGLDETTQHENELAGYECDKKPNPPLTGYLSCLNYSQKLECTGTCMPDYVFSNGNTAMTLTCSFTTGKWSPLGYFPPCYLKESLPDNNDDELLEPEDISPTSNTLCSKPLTPKGGYIHCEQQFSHGYRRCTGTCMPGFSFPNGESTMSLRCSIVRGWLPYSSFPSCKENKDRIYQPEVATPATNNQDENVDMTGVINRGVCRQPLSPKYGYIYCVPNADTLECTAKCTQGFRFPNGENRLIYRCDNKSGRWSPQSQFPDCQSACDIPCNNGGVCVRPNQCFCPQDYRGNFCQYPLSNCDPQYLKFAGSIRCNHTTEETTCSLGCPQRMILEPSYNTVRCSLEGTWTPRHIPRCVEDPRYRDVDLHGNLCGTSQCSSSNIHDGSLCHRPPPPKPGYIRCIYNQLIMECTSKCADGYRFPNGAREQIRSCDNRTGIWSPREQFTDCEPICDRECQNGGRCLAPNFCFCPVKYRGNQCQYPLSNCDPHRLRFAGSIRCSHSSEETICKLGCPDGTVLDNPAYDTVRCNLVGEWTPRYVPRCVDANEPRRPIYSDSRINRDFHQESTHNSQNNYEQHYRESLTEQQRLNYEKQLQQRTENLNQHTQSRDQYDEHQRLTNTDSSENEQSRDMELEKESYEQRLKLSQEEEQRKLYDKILNQNSKNHSDYNYQQRQNASHLLDRLREQQHTETTHSETNEFDSLHQNNREHFKDYENLQTNMDKFGHTPRYPSTGSNTHHTDEEEIRGYGHRFYHQRINQSESGTYREHSAQQQHYFHQYQRTAHKNSDKHSCILCTTG